MALNLKKPVYIFSLGILLGAGLHQTSVDAVPTPRVGSTCLSEPEGPPSCDRTVRQEMNQPPPGGACSPYESSEPTDPPEVQQYDWHGTAPWRDDVPLSDTDVIPDDLYPEKTEKS